MVCEIIGFWLTKSITNEDSPNPRIRVCCDEEIIRRGEDGFSSGDIIQTMLNKDCTTAVFNAKTDNLRIRLTGFYVSISHILNIKDTTFDISLKILQPFFRKIPMKNSVLMI